MMATIIQDISTIKVKTGLEGDLDGRNAVFTRDIPINDNKNRYQVTPLEVQKQIMEDTNVHMIVRGKYLPDERLATDRDPPMYIHLTAGDTASLENAVALISDLLKDRPKAAAGDAPKIDNGSKSDQMYERSRNVEVTVPVGMENLRNFHLRAKLVGQNGANIRYVEAKSKCRVQLRGGSQALVDLAELPRPGNSDEQCYMHISGQSQEAVDGAVSLCRNLIESVKTEYDSFCRDTAENSTKQRAASATATDPKSFKTTQFQVSSYPTPSKQSTSNSSASPHMLSQPTGTSPASGYPSAIPSGMQATPPNMDPAIAASMYQYYYTNPAYYAYLYQYYYGQNG